MAKTKLHQRAFALSLAILFLFTAVATGAAVIYSVYSQDKANSSSSKSSSSTSSSGSKTHLAGTLLQGFTPVSNVSSLQIIDTKVGTGTVATPTSTVSVLYTGAVAATGKIFQASTDSGPSPVTFPLNQVIVGWQKGIPGMKIGGTRQLLIPANEAYGANPPANSGIPPNATLVFNITLLNVQQ